MPQKVTNVHIVSHRRLITPRETIERLPLEDDAQNQILQFRTEVQNILRGEDPRLFVVVGPCSIHDSKAALEYADRLAELSNRVQDVFQLIMRVYFEKPRTVTGWKGYINDPRLDDSFHIEEGLLGSRELLLQILKKGLPAATEALDPITPQYFGDLITWTAIGARTTESQTHREMASGLSTPVGFKNGTDGSVEVAINAIRSAALSHRFLGINPEGECAVFHTRGNPYGHLVLRGGKTPNYDTASVAKYEAALRTNRLQPSLVVDCSHGNSQKDHNRQPAVFAECVEQIAAGNRSIVGLMLESHLLGGRQDIPKNLKELRYGVSVTDACIDWNTTETCLLEAAERLRPTLAQRAKREAVLA